MNLILALIWTLALICDIIAMLMGDEPSWVLALCPLIILVWDRWGHYIKEKRNE